jgi:hypothetical protein
MILAVLPLSSVEPCAPVTVNVRATGLFSSSLTAYAWANMDPQMNKAVNVAPHGLVFSYAGITSQA